MSIFRKDILENHVALVTGGGTGICKAIAMQYARHGARVCVVGRRVDVVEATAAELKANSGVDSLGLAADVRHVDQLESVVDSVVRRWGALTTLVNGAAGNFLAPIAALSSNGFKTVVDIDLNGTFNASKACFEALKKSGDGLVLNISATLHYHGTPLQAHAAAAKAGVDALTRTLAVEWGSLGIRANAIAPGPIGDTEGMRRLAPAGADAALKKHIPLGRFGNCDEIAAMAVFLRSPAAAYITGSVFVIDGGQSVAVPAFTDL